MGRGHLVCLLGSFLVLCAEWARGVDIEWKAAVAGDFTVGTNWDGNAAPGIDDRAIFDNDADPAYTVTLDAGRTIEGWHLFTDRVTLDLDGRTLTVTEAASGIYANNDDLTLRAALHVARGESGDHHTGTLILEGGGTLNTTSLLVAATSGSNGTMIVRGANTRLEVDTAAEDEAVFAARGTGTLQVLDGATVQFGSGGMAMGRSTVSRPNVLVDGANSRMLSDGGMFLGRFTREGMTRVQNGGLIAASGTMRLGRDSTLIVDNATANFGSAIMGISNGECRIEVLHGGLLSLSGTLQASSGTTSGIETHVVVTGSNGTGTTSRFTSTSSVYIGGSTTIDRGHDTSMAVSDGGTADMAGRLRLYSRGALTVDAGTVQASELDARAGSEFALSLHEGRFDADLRIDADGTFDGNVILAYDGDTGEGVTFTLSLADGFTAAIGETFTILTYDGSLAGTFLGLTDGAVIPEGGFEFEIDYGTGSNSAITLEVIPEPHSLALIALGLGTMALRRRLA